MTDTIDTLCFDSGRDGPVFLALGAIHGNETCGTAGLARAAVELRAGVFGLARGKLVLAPICNPAAYRQNVRFTQENLNRVICPHAAPSAYEHHLALQVMALIDAADIVLDLHSYGSGTKPFLFLDHDTPAHRAYAAALGIADWVTGWNDAYAGAQDLNAGDTMTYAHSQGKTGILVECGAHEAPESAAVAYQSLRRALAHAGITAAYDAAPPAAPGIHRLLRVVAKEKDGSFARPWQHLDAVAKGDTIAAYDDGSTLAAEQDCVIILPKATAKTGDEWFYIGVPA